VPDVEYTPHENTFPALRKRNHKWVKLKSDWHKVTFTLDFFLALKDEVCNLDVARRSNPVLLTFSDILLALLAN